MEVKGRNLIEGVPRTVNHRRQRIRESLSEGATIVNAVRVALERTPPNFRDISDRGIVLTGGGALLKNLDKRIAKRPAASFDRRRPARFGRSRTGKCSATQALAPGLH